MKTSTLERAVPSVLAAVEVRFRRARRQRGEGLLSRAILEDAAFKYIRDSGMLKRKWIGTQPLARVIHLRHAIYAMTKGRYRNLLMTALAASARDDVSNLSGGPEVYVRQNGQRRGDVITAWLRRVDQMIEDLDSVDGRSPEVSTSVIEADSRDCRSALQGQHRFSMLITSPPYPTEHDYTRNVRLELAITGHVRDLASLRKIKRSMVRSNSKAIYKEDSDHKVLTRADVEVGNIVERLRKKAERRTDGFAQQYPKVVAEYFGGMIRHLADVRRFARKGATYALVLGDQQSFLGVPIRTANVLASLITRRPELRLSVREIITIRKRHSVRLNRHLSENVLILQQG